jgi:hypothetical protein
VVTATRKNSFERPDTHAFAVMRPFAFAVPAAAASSKYANCSAFWQDLYYRRPLATRTKQFKLRIESRNEARRHPRMLAA